MTLSREIPRVVDTLFGGFTQTGADREREAQTRNGWRVSAALCILFVTASCSSDQEIADIERCRDTVMREGLEALDGTVDTSQGGSIEVVKASEIATAGYLTINRVPFDYTCAVEEDRLRIRIVGPEDDVYVDSLFRPQ